MNRTGLLSALALMFASAPSFAQFGGMGGMGGMGGGVGPRAPGSMMQGGGFAGTGFTEVRRSVHVEMEGGQRLSGTMDLRSVIVDGDLGRYVIMPDKIKMIRFLKPAIDVDEGVEGGEGGVDVKPPVPKGLQNRGVSVRAVRAARGGFGGMADRDPQTGAALARGKVITTTDQEIIGTIHIPTDFRLLLDFGTVSLAPTKLRSITFSSVNRQDKPKPADAAAAPTPAGAGRIALVDGASPPRYFRQGSSLIVISPVGDRAMLLDTLTQQTQSLELSGSKDAPLEVTLIANENIGALGLHGSKITRIAVADTTKGVWHSQDLDTPVQGQILPIIGPGVVLYNVGRDVYAYSARSERWDVTKLPDGVRASPMFGAPGTVTIEGQGHIYTFVGESGKWEHIDVRAVLESGGAAKK